MKNHFRTSIPFHWSNLTSSPEIIAARDGNGGHTFGDLRPQFIDPEFVIRRVGLGQTELEYIKIIKADDGTETSVTPNSSEIFYWTDSEGYGCFGYNGSNFVFLNDCGIYYYKVKFQDEASYYYSDYFFFTDQFTATNYGRKHVRLRATADCVVAGIPHDKPTEQPFELNAYLEAQEIHTINEFEQEVETDLDFNDTIVSSVSRRRHLLVVKNCHPPTYDQLCRMQHYVDKQLDYWNGIDNMQINTPFTVTRFEVQEPDFTTGGTYSPTVRILIEYEDKLVVDSCCDELAPCAEVDIPRPNIAAEGVNDMRVTTPTDVELPDNTWLVIEYRASALSPWTSVIVPNVTVFNAAGYLIEGLSPGDYTARLTIKNWNCSESSEESLEETIGSSPD